MRLPRLLTAAVAAVALLALPALAATGPDVSSYQHPGGASVDWSRLAASGQDFTWLKATEGTGYTNPWYARDEAGARGAGLYVGAYHFARPSTAVGSAAAQARAFAAVVGDLSRPGTLPPALDLEVTGGLSPTALTAWTRTFLTTLEALTGRHPVLYTYPSFWSTALGRTTAFAGYPLWVAHYTAAAAPSVLGWSDWTFWQYSSTSTVAGVQGEVDMDRFHGTDADLARLALATTPAAGAGSGLPTGTAPGAEESARQTAPGRYVALPASRVLDTRSGVGTAPGPVSGPVTLTLPDRVPTDSAGVVLSVSAVEPTGDGWLRAAAAGEPATTTALNWSARSSTTGLVVTRTDAARRVALTALGGATHLVADLVGYYDGSPGTGGGYTALTPSRVLDTRRGGGTPVSGRLPVGLPDTVPAGARAAVLDVAVVGAVHDTVVQVLQDGGKATVLNVHGGTSQSGLVLAPGGRTVALAVSGGPAHVVVDLLGYYGADDSGARYVGSLPTRVVDTRLGLGAPRGSSTVTVALPGVPAGGTALLDVSAVAPQGPGFLRVAPPGESPTTTALTTGSGTRTGLVVSRVDSTGQVTLTLSGGAADLVVDLVGWSAGGAGPAAG